MQGIAADQEDQVGIWVLMGDQVESIKRILRAGSVHVDRGKLKMEFIPQRKLQHGEPVFERADGLVKFVRRLGGQHP